MIAYQLKTPVRVFDSNLARTATNSLLTLQEVQEVCEHIDTLPYIDCDDKWKMHDQLYWDQGTAESIMQEAAEDKAEAAHRRHAIITGEDVLEPGYAYVWVAFLPEPYWWNHTLEPMPINRSKWSKAIGPDEDHWLEFEMANGSLNSTWFSGSYSYGEVVKDMERMELCPGQRVLYRFAKPHYSQSHEGDWDADFYEREIGRERISPRTARHRWADFKRFRKANERYYERMRVQLRRLIAKRPQDLYVRFSFTSRDVMSPVTNRTARLYTNADFYGYREHNALAEVTLQGNVGFGTLRDALAAIVVERYPSFPADAVHKAPRVH